MDDFETAKQLFFEGLQLLGASNFQAAEIKFEQSLKIIPDRVSTLTNLSLIKIKLKKFGEAEEFALKAVALEDKSTEAWSNLGIALAAAERHEESLHAYNRALNCNSSNAGAWLNKAMTLLKLKRYDEALPACDHALGLDPGKYEILFTKSLILKELDQPDEAEKLYRKSLDIRIASSPAFIAERRATQKADALIINENPVFNGSLRSFESLHRSCVNFPGQLEKYFHEDFHFTYVFPGNAISGSARKLIPQPDFVINNNVNGERILSEGNLSGLIALVDSFAVPVVNHPAKAVQTTRDMSARLLNDLSGVVLPKTLRFSSVGKSFATLAHEIEDQYNYPLIVRTLVAHEGKGMTRVDTRDALGEVLYSGFPEEFFVTQFVDSRGGNKLFRKIRAAIVENEIIIVRVEHDPHWKIYARRSDERVAFYLENPGLLQEEKRICGDPEAGLGRAAIQALRAIRNRIPLDVFGVDFDVDPDGLLVFYEANASMNLFSTARAEVPYPKEPEDSLKQAFHRYFTSLAAPS